MISSYDNSTINLTSTELSSGWIVSSVLNAATLSGLVLNNATMYPRFFVENSSYTSVITNDFEPITITPFSNDIGAVITINGTIVESGHTSDRIPLVSGDNIINVVVTSLRAVTTVYTITITAITKTQTVTVIYNNGSSVDHVGVVAIDSYITGDLPNVNTVLLGPGIYTVNSAAGNVVISRPITIAASIGRTATIKMINAPWSGSEPPCVITCSNGAALKGLVIDANSVNNIVAIYPTYFTDLPVSSRIEGPEYRCVIMYNGTIDNCHFINWTTGGAGEVFPIWGFNASFTNCLIDNPVSVGPAEPYVTVVTGENLQCNNISIIMPDSWDPWVVWPGTNVLGNKYPKMFGFTVYNGSTITNCYVKNCTTLYHNDSLDVNNVNISNNTADHTVQGFASWGHNNSNVTITGNNFKVSPYMNGTTIGWAGYGIVISMENNAALICTNLKITNNTINIINTGDLATPILILTTPTNTFIPEVHNNIITGVTTRGSRFNSSNINVTGTQGDFLASL